MPDKGDVLHVIRAIQRVLGWIWMAVLAAIIFLGTAEAEDRFILLQSTTSTRDSGLYDAILPGFTTATGIIVRVVAAGTGQAIKNAMNGDSDVLLVHDQSSEEKFVKDGYGLERFDVMYNDFVLVGPSMDPAGLKDAGSAVEALQRILSTGAVFMSRGDSSGTHKKEIQLWHAMGVDPASVSGNWYWETGSSMGATLNVAVEKNAYCLTDRSTWINFRNKRDFEILFEGDPGLFNQYGAILINPAKHSHVRIAEGLAFIDWLLGKEGQQAIASYKVGGEQLFFPNAK